VSEFTEDVGDAGGAGESDEDHKYLRSTMIHVEMGSRNGNGEK